MTAGIAILIFIVLVLITTGFIFYMRSKKSEEQPVAEDFDLITKYGTKFKLSPHTKDITIVDVESWTDDIVDFWKEAKGWDPIKSSQIIGKIFFTFLDAEILVRMGKKINGIFYPSTFKAEFAVLPKNSTNSKLIYDRTRSLFFHETSHVIASYVGNMPWDEQLHHSLFAEVGLRA